MIFQSISSLGLIRGGRVGRGLGSLRHTALSPHLASSEGLATVLKKKIGRAFPMFRALSVLKEENHNL